MSTREYEVPSFPCEAFLLEIQPRLMAFLRRSTIPSEDAEDILQQTLIALVYKWPELHNPEAWLFKVLHNKCLVYWRERHRRPYEAVDDGALERLAPALLPRQEQRDRARDLRTAVARLSPRRQRLLALVYWKDLDSGEVARHLGYRVSSINKIKRRCLDALREQLQLLGWRDDRKGK